MFLRNAWYAAAWEREIGASPYATTILGESVAIFRGASGKYAALADACPHRKVPLSMGRVQGDDLECGYHGLVFDCAGSCVRVPSGDHPPQGASVRSYPIEPRYGLLWMWMGDPVLAVQVRAALDQEDATVVAVDAAQHLAADESRGGADQPRLQGAREGRSLGEGQAAVADHAGRDAWRRRRRELAAEEAARDRRSSETGLIERRNRRGHSSLLAGDVGALGHRGHRRGRARPAPAEHRPAPGDDVWLMNVGPGDTFELPTVIDAPAK